MRDKRKDWKCQMSNKKGFIDGKTMTKTKRTNARTISCYCHYKKFQIQSTSYKYIHPLHQVLMVWYYFVFRFIFYNCFTHCLTITLNLINKWQKKKQRTYKMHSIGSCCFFFNLYNLNSRHWTLNWLLHLLTSHNILQ